MNLRHVFLHNLTYDTYLGSQNKTIQLVDIESRGSGGKDKTMSETQI